MARGKRKNFAQRLASGELYTVEAAVKELIFLCVFRNGLRRKSGHLPNIEPDAH